MKTCVTTAGCLLAVWASLPGCESARRQSTPARFFDSQGVQIRYQVWGS